MPEPAPDLGRSAAPRPRRPARFRGCPRAGLSAGDAKVELVVARTPLARLLGLAALDGGLAPALLIPRCRSVHSFGMRFALDVAFVVWDERGERLEVLSVERVVGPRRVVSLGRGSAPRDGTPRVAALELAAGGPGVPALHRGGRLALVAEPGRNGSAGRRIGT